MTLKLFIGRIVVVSVPRSNFAKHRYVPALRNCTEEMNNWVPSPLTWTPNDFGNWNKFRRIKGAPLYLQIVGDHARDDIEWYNNKSSICRISVGFAKREIDLNAKMVSHMAFRSKVTVRLNRINISASTKMKFVIRSLKARIFSWT